MRKPETLAPAGSMETLSAALRTGADAVYVGGKRFSARSSASNFSDEELAQAAALCHRYGAKLYLAVNTIISDSESQDFCNYIKYTSSIGVDAYIVQDFGCAEIIKKAVPDAVLHASTQMSVHTAVGAEMLSEFGWERVVPARELDSKAIKKICDADIETEIFVHGALCMSVSGQCYMSAVMGSRSANRGCCGQACRLPYSAAENKKFSALSLKDLSLLPNTDELSAIGVDSLKIEGRMKRPEYVASAVNELNKALNGETPDMQFLRGVFSRSGFTNGYFTGNKKDMFGVREKEDVIAARSLIPEIHELYRFERTAYEIDIHAVIAENENVEITAKCGNTYVTVYGDIPDKAQNRPTDLSAVEKQLSKLGDTVFRAKSITADIDDGLFIPMGKLNELRRELAEKLTEKITEKNTPKYNITEYSPSLPKYSKQTFGEKLPLRVYCRTAEQAETAIDKAEFIIADSRIWLCGNVPSFFREYSDRIILSPPRFMPYEDAVIKRISEMKDEYGINRIFCHTPDFIAIGRKLGMKMHGSFTLNVFNSYSAEKMAEFGLEDCVFSMETTLEQLDKVRTAMPLGLAVYGNLPLMLTVNCPIENEVGCKNCTRTLTDRTGRKLPVVCSRFYKEILNPDVLYMLDRTDELKNITFGLVFLNDENAQQTKNVLSCVKPDGKITRGLYYRGIQ